MPVGGNLNFGFFNSVGSDGQLRGMENSQFGSDSMVINNLSSVFQQVAAESSHPSSVNLTDMNFGSQNQQLVSIFLYMTLLSSPLLTC